MDFHNMELIGKGATADVYRDGDRAIKLYKGIPAREVREEAQRQAFASEAGLPVPRVYDVLEDGGEVALVMEYAGGVELAERCRQGAEQRAEALETLVKLQCSVHSVQADGLRALTDTYRWKIDHADSLNDGERAALHARIDALDNGANRLCHGDFHVKNVLEDDGRLWIIDWVDAARGDPNADACRTYVIMRQYMARYANTYLRMFCKASGAKEGDILSWLPVTAGARLYETKEAKAVELLRGLMRNDENNHL